MSCTQRECAHACMAGLPRLLAVSEQHRGVAGAGVWISTPCTRATSTASSGSRTRSTWSMWATWPASTKCPSSCAAPSPTGALPVAAQALMPSHSAAG